MMFSDSNATIAQKQEKLLPSLIIEKELAKNQKFNNIVKVGRTHLQDAHH